MLHPMLVNRTHHLPTFEATHLVGAQGVFAVLIQLLDDLVQATPIAQDEVVAGITQRVVG